MSTSDRLRELIFEQFKNIREFSEHAKMPYTTVRSILERGVENSSVDNVIKMCRALGTTIDELINEGKQTSDGYYIDPAAAKAAQEIYDNPNLRILFDASRKASPEALKAAAALIELMEKEENGSDY